ncbi:MAG: TetR/AcrR family transcriptional regulator [Acidimicrobiia bacterium]|nr:TetR/AcrR family transcriptional regulator [Acidimicrobiia bacterium]
MISGQTSKRLPREQRREAILRSSAKAFARCGYAATSMEDTAAAAGVTKLILYRHFASKEDLYRAVVEDVAERMGAALAAGRERGEFYGLHARAMLEVARADPDGFKLLWRHAAREEGFADHVEALRRQAVRRAVPIIAGYVDDPGVQVWAAETVVTFLVFSVMHWLECGDPDRDDDFVLLCTRSLKALLGAWAGDALLLAGVLDVAVPPLEDRVAAAGPEAEVPA